jgi:O-antigen/teichoic acid export membrane protein
LKRQPSIPVARNLLGFGIRSHASTLSNILNERVDQLVISLFLSSRQLGLYVVAVTVTAPITLIGSSIGMVALPGVARAKTEVEMRRIATRFVVGTVILASAVTVPLLALTEPLLGLLFGADFRPVSDVARIQLLASINFSHNRTLGAVL